MGVGWKVQNFRMPLVRELLIRAYANVGGYVLGAAREVLERSVSHALKVPKKLVALSP